LTKIFDVGDFWIESFTVIRQTVNATTVEENFTLEKSGHFVGVSGILDTADQTATGIRNIGVNIKKTDGTEISYGDEISAIRVQMGNTGNFIIGAKIIVFMRK